MGQSPHRNRRRTFTWLCEFCVRVSRARTGVDVEESDDRRSSEGTRIETRV